MPFSPTLPVAKSVLIDKVTQLFGLKDDNEMRGLAEHFLDDAIKEMNSYLFEFSRTMETGITLSASTQDYTLSGGLPFKESQAYLVNSSSGDAAAPLHYLPYVHFKRLFALEENTDAVSTAGVPYAYTIRNLHDDGVVSLFPIPNTSTASSWTLTVEYYTRIPLVSELALDTSQLDVPQEVETALVFGGQKRMAIHIHGPGHDDVKALDALENRARTRLQAIDRHHPDSNTRFRLATHSRGSRRHIGVNSNRGLLIVRS